MPDKYYQVDMDLGVGVVLPAQNDIEAITTARKRLKKTLEREFSTYGLRVDFETENVKEAKAPQR